MLPTMLRMDDVETLVVGGGPVAARRAGNLVANGAHVVVVSPSLCDALQRMAADGEVRWEARPFERADVRRRRVVVAATDSRETNAEIADAADAEGAWINVADDSGRSSLHFPAAVTRGRLTIAVATEGVSPAVSRRIRERVEHDYGEEFAELLELLAAVRPDARSRIATQPGRRRFYEGVLGSEALSLLRDGRSEDARSCVSDLLDAHAGDEG
ncbi:MAG: NAD(P)-dependent oxidoreductase [Candidatus Poribacteria bacterium]